MGDNLATYYRITEQTLDLRRQFIQLGPEDVLALARLYEWAKRRAPDIARDFYDHQFSFPPTLAFFEKFARDHNRPLSALRSQLEGAQAKYFVQIFEEAAQGGKFGKDYFEKRLQVGRIHNIIDLPLKFYLGSYAFYFDLVRKYLRQDFRYRRKTVESVERAVYIVFNYDMQAVCDSFLLDMMESAGFDLVNVPVAEGRDLTEYVGYVKRAFSEEIQHVAEALSSGDLTLQISPRSETDTIRLAFCQIIQQLRDVVGQVSHASEKVKVNAGDILAFSNRTSEACAQISQTMVEAAKASEQSSQTSTEIARASEQQAISATEAASAMQMLQEAVDTVQQGGAQQQMTMVQADEAMRQAAQAVEQVARSAQEMAVTSQKASEITQAGSAAVRQTVSSIERIREQVTASSHKIRELGEKGQEIGNIVETINQIAEQTNLLALNAAIEAARAGEHGRGFAVVADEVRKLAERAASATKEIAGLIGEVRRGVEESVRAMEACTQEVTTGVQRSQQAGQALGQILQSVQSVTQEVDEVNSYASEMEASVQEVVASISSLRQVAQTNEASMEKMVSCSERVSNSITSVASVSQQTAAGAQEMSASAQEVTASFQEISSQLSGTTQNVKEIVVSVQQLNELAVHLSNLIRVFRLDSARAQTRSESPDSTLLLRAA